MVKWGWKLSSGRNHFSKLWKILQTFLVLSVTPLLPLLSLWSRKSSVEEGSVCSNLLKLFMNKALWGKELNGSNRELVCHEMAGNNTVMALLWISLLLKSVWNMESSCVVPVGKWVSHTVVVWEHMASVWRKYYITRPVENDFFLESLIGGSSSKD